jgi:subfamily B ATP-binding cassette protein MsbA
MDAATPAMLRARLAPRDDTRELISRLWREHLHRYRGRVGIVLALTLLVAGTQALYPVLIDHAINLFEHRDPRILYQVPALVVSVTAVKALAQYFQTVLMQQVVLLVIRDLQGRLFRHLTAADLARLEREAPATLAARFTTDAATIREAMTRAVNGMADAVTVVGLVASMLYLDWELSLIAALLYPMAALPIQRIGRKVRSASGGMQERIGEVAALLTESFAQARTVRAWRLEAFETARADGAFATLYRALMAMNRSRARIDPILEFLGGAAVAAVLGFAGWRAAMGGSTLGSFTGFVTALLIAARPLRALGSLNAALQEGLAGLARVFTVLDEPPAITDRPGARALPDGQGEVEFRGVAFRYPDGRMGLRDLSFRAAPGLTVALVGPSGAGKSTALSLIPRLHDATAGRILIDGADVRDLSLASLRGAIAYVGQDALLFDTSVAENVRMGRPEASEAEMQDALRAAAADVFVRLLPQGAHTPVGPGGQRLSGGQRQRVAVARALLAHARVLLLDEATSALDAESEAAVQQALGVLRRGRTTIVVAHRLSTVRDADLVVVLEEGRAVEQGTHVTLLSAGGLYARLVRTQTFVA